MLCRLRSGADSNDGRRTATAFRTVRRAVEAVRKVAASAKTGNQDSRSTVLLRVGYGQRYEVPRLNFADGEVLADPNWIDVLPWQPDFSAVETTADGCPYLGSMTVQLRTQGTALLAGWSLDPAALSLELVLLRSSLEGSSGMIESGRAASAAGAGGYPPVSWEHQASATIQVSGLEASTTAAAATYRISVNGQVWCYRYVLRTLCALDQSSGGPLTPSF